MLSCFSHQYKHYSFVASYQHLCAGLISHKCYWLFIHILFVLYVINMDQKAMNILPWVLLNSSCSIRERLIVDIIKYNELILVGVLARTIRKSYSLLKPLGFIIANWPACMRIRFIKIILFYGLNAERCALFTTYFVFIILTLMFLILLLAS